MNTMTQTIALMRGPYRVSWHGGEYADVTAPGLGVIDTINMTRPDGTIPEMTRQNLREAVGPEEVQTWRETAAELRRFPIGGRQ